MRQGARVPKQPHSISLLWPEGRPSTSTAHLSEQTIADLHLDAIVQAIVGTDADAPAGRLLARQRYARDLLTTMLLDTETILRRQAVLGDLLEQPELRERLEQLLPTLEALGEIPSGERYRPSVDVGLERVARRLADLELVVDAVLQLTDALRDAPVSSSGLRDLRTAVDALRASPEFAALERELPGLRRTLSSVRSVTLGVNLAADLTPESATILELRDAPIDGRRALLFRLLGGSSANQALTPLQRGEAGPLGRPNELVRDLRHLLSEIVAPVHTALQRFSRVSTEIVSQLGLELALLLGEARLIDGLRACGVPVCCPELTHIEERRAELLDLYDVELALSLAAASGKPVTNAARFDAQTGRVWVLTGPNRGGKTTYTRAVGLAQVLFQVGMYVPASSARISPVDAIYSHFPTAEETLTGGGRLDSEARRLAAIFQQASPRSLILLNEALAGTSALEALDLARGLVRALRLLGARAIYVTHLHELALEVDHINANTPGDGTVASLVANSASACEFDGSPDVRRTYRIVPGPPLGMSFAAEIAEQHGISFPQLARLLRERHFTP